MTADKPIGIAFSPALVREVLAGRKSMTRRGLKMIVHPDVEAFRTDGHGQWYAVSRVAETGGLGIPGSLFRCPYGAPGSMLYVKEELRPAPVMAIAYGADGAPVRDEHGADFVWQWRTRVITARYCPRWASRISLRVTDVRVERVQAISDEDVAREGVNAESVEAMLESLASRVDPKPCHWLTGETKDGDNPAGPNYCRRCAEKEARAINRAGGEVVVDGGWSTDHDLNPYCRTCGAFLDGYLTEAGIEQELEHFAGGVGDVAPTTAYELLRIVDRMPPRLLWEVAWTLINGAESWRANPWAWVVSFENANVLAQGERGVR